ncbi:MAG: glycosyltransferase family 9 protein [Candidatus Kapaibacteriota bacterium]
MLDNIYVFPKSLWGRVSIISLLKRNKYDLIIDLYDNPSFSSSILIRFAKPKFSLGFDKENRNVYTHIVALLDKMKVHIVDRLRQLLLPFGYENYELNFVFPLKMKNPLPNKYKKRVGIVVSGSSPSKNWGLVNIAELIRMMNEKFDYELVVFGTKEHKDLIQSLNRLENTIIAPFTDDFDEFVAMVVSCDYIITPDTSVVHLASAFNIPVVVLYTFVDERFGMPWFPYKTKFEAIISKMDSYDDVKPEKVLKAFQKLMQ